MKIYVNNKLIETQATSLCGLAEELSLPEKGVAVAIGSKMVPRLQWSETALSEEMSVVIIKAAQGG